MSSVSSERLALMVKVAHLYHVEGLTQPDVAERLHITQSRASRLLRDAVALGLVRTVVSTPSEIHVELERALRERYRLQDVVVASATVDDDAAVLTSIGSAGAEYVQATLLPGDRIGIPSRSMTLLAVVESMVPATRQGPAAAVVQILGAIGNPAVQIQATRLTDRLAELTGAAPYYLVAPGVVSSLPVREGLMTDPYLRQTVQAWADLTTVLVGIGSLGAGSRRAPSGPAFPEADLDALLAAGAVGDVCLHFFDDSGAPTDLGLRDRVLGISEQELRNVPRRIGVGGGPSKTGAIRAALTGGWINVLITDEHTARRLLD
jgi:DNA-binding transcriptional regulator LsrR (DeoR family)